VARIQAIVAAGLAGFVLFHHHDDGATRAQGNTRPLTVAAASDLKFALEEVGREWHARRPDIEVRVTYGSSGSFFAQISNRAPFDMFFSADMEYVRRLQAEGLTVPGSEFVYATGRIVLWSRSESSLDVTRGVAALRAASVRRVAVANPQHAPYGRAAEAALKSLGVYEEVRPKLVFGEDVSQAAQFVESGAADAGIIALSLALSPTLSREGRFWEFPVESYPKMEQGAVTLKRARDVEAASAFRSFILGGTGLTILKRFGFFAPGA
jgi:molybdate transport system substrate-binding protein